MEDFKGFLSEYKGAIIGGILGIIVLCTGLLRFALAVIVLCVGVFLGNYVQHNKYEVKQKLLDFINRL